MFNMFNIEPTNLIATSIICWARIAPCLPPPPSSWLSSTSTDTYLKKRHFKISSFALYKPFKVADILVVILTADLDNLAQQLVPESKMMILMKMHCLIPTCRSSPQPYSYESSASSQSPSSSSLTPSQKEGQVLAACIKNETHKSTSIRLPNTLISIIKAAKDEIFVSGDRFWVCFQDLAHCQETEVLQVLVRILNKDSQLLHTQLDTRGVIGHPCWYGD